RVARDVIERVFLFYIAAGLADDDGQLAFEIEAFGNLRPDHLAVIADQGVEQTREQGRLRRQGASDFGRMRLVVDADAQDFVRVRDDRQEAQILDLMIRRAAGEAAHFRQTVVRDGVT